MVVYFCVFKYSLVKMLVQRYKKHFVEVLLHVKIFSIFFSLEYHHREGCFLPSLIFFSKKKFF